LYLDIENTGHTRAKAESPQTNGICGRFNKTCKDGFYSTAFGKKFIGISTKYSLAWMEWAGRYNLS
jgi:hypothetical protein